MKKGFSLIETLVAVLIVGILAAFALPYYFNAVENTKATEVTMLWGRLKNMAAGNRNFTQGRAERYAREVNEKNQLKNFTMRILCRPKDNPEEICWEAEFVKKNENERLLYKLVTYNNFRELACVGLNGNGEEFCFTLTNESGEKIPVGNEMAYIVKY